MKSKSMLGATLTLFIAAYLVLVPFSASAQSPPSLAGMSGIVTKGNDGCPSGYTYCSNGNEGGSHTATQLGMTTTTYLWTNVATTSNSPWSYQWNMFFENANGGWAVSQTTVEVSSSSCEIGTGYGTSDPYETQYPVSCSSVTQAGDDWEVATTWPQTFLGDLYFYLNGNLLYELSMSQICTGYSGCAIADTYSLYIQSVFVGASTTYPSAVFTSLSGSTSYTGVTPLTSYTYCTGETSNSVYNAFSGSGTSWSQTYLYIGSTAYSNCI